MWMHIAFTEGPVECDEDACDEMERLWAFQEIKRRAKHAVTTLTRSFFGGTTPPVTVTITTDLVLLSRNIYIFGFDHKRDALV